MEYNKMSEDPLFNGQGYVNPAENAENKRIEKTGPEQNQIFKSEDPAENDRIVKAYPEEEATTDPVDGGTEG